ncbi:kinase domain protein (macronuclear) [Tetrahymena thermophila SB210]|uniref:Kinase domain protein n=1 Tax=Tetrahymena thermophila (strain SB210) TaxID=312017 RepID=I7MM44_TETTS|nr:kinase domain protein [Tetrahymena thermophila SB210]EAS03936.2 kinase domain protein [Tetrahymena thermophila SB210]|eukprot:XP_001024181.2 kinase domain protein [Tetrahymena thermophila SB210]
MIDNQNIGSDDELDIYEPGTSGEIISYLKRNFNTLNDQVLGARKKAILNIYEKLSESQFAISGMVSQQIMVKFNKQLLQCFSDRAEKIREYSIKIISELLSKCDDMQPFLPYVISIVCERVNCQDLEGILNVPEVMRPPPGQKPKMLIKLVEESEELRQELCKLMHVIVTCSNSNMLYNHVDDICNILRALSMDPCSEVQKLACKCVSEFCINNKELLLHFTEILARGLLLPLISKKSKVRIAALEALGSVLQCGVWKYNANVFEILVGFRDPNSVPIKDFYEPSHNINYLATFITDPKVNVRDMFLRCVGDWVSRLPDRYDHLPRLIPYLISGLFDDFEEIRETCFEVLEEAGQEEEREKEKELREAKQFGMDSDWTYGGKLKNLPLPDPIKKRPCLGARMLVRGQYRKFQKALFNELKDNNLSARIRAANLMRISVIYCEDYMTQFLDDVIRSLVWQLVSDKAEEKVICQKIQESFFYIGRFCDFNTYLPIIKSGLSGEFYQNEDYVRCSFEGLAQLVKGSLEAIPNGQGIGKKMKLVEEVLDIITEKSIINSISTFNYVQAANLMEGLIRGILKQGKKEEVEILLKQRYQKLMTILGIISYIQLVDKAFIVTTPLSYQILDTIIQAAQNSDVFKLLNDILDYSESKLQLFSEKVTQAADNLDSLNFGDITWKSLVGQVIYHILYENSFENVAKIYEIINYLVKNSQIPDLCDFVSKLNALFIQKIKIQLKNPQLKMEGGNQLSLFYGGLLESQSLVTKWMQDETAKIKITQQFIQNFYLLYKFNIEGLFESDIDKMLQDYLERGSLQNLSSLIGSIPILHKKFYKKQDIDMTKLLQFIIKKIHNKIQPYLKELYIGEGDQKLFVVPLLIAYTIERLERLGDPADLKLAAINFETLDLLLEYIPTVADQPYLGDKHIFENYTAFIQKMIKYALDEKDVEIKAYYLATLKKLVNKTTFNFRMEYESAISNKQFARIDLLKVLQPK